MGLLFLVMREDSLQLGKDIFSSIHCSRQCRQYTSLQLQGPNFTGYAASPEQMAHSGAEAIAAASGYATDLRGSFP